MTLSPHLPTSHPEAGADERTPAPLDPSTDVAALPAAASNGEVPEFPAPAPGYTADQLIEGAERARKLRHYWGLTSVGLSAEDAARDLGVSRVSLYRWERTAAAVGINHHTTDPHQLTNALALALATRQSPGAPCAWGYLLKRPTVVQELRAAYMATIGSSSESAARDRSTGSVALAIEHFAESPHCPEALAARLRTGYQPSEFVRLLRQITPEIESLARGSKNYLHHGPISRRSDTVAGTDGQLYQMPAGYVVEFDDMSSNQPFFVRNPDGTVSLSRQGLYARDRHSRRWLACDLIARPREAYRAEDILRFVRKLSQDFGKPSVLRFEQGIWKARVIRGIEITPDGQVTEPDWEVPAADPEQKQLLQDGLSALGIRIQYVVGSRGKGSLESAFRYLQSVIAIRTQEFINIGRHAGEFEHGAKALRRARAESHTPEALGFAPQHILADRIADAFAWINSRTTDGPSPDELWAADIAARPLARLTDLDLAFLLPEERELTIRGGRVTATCDGEPLDFRAPELFASLGDGYRVRIRFDSSEPTLRASVFNAETSTRNHLGARLGQFLGWADYETPGPGIRAETEAETAGLLPVNMDKWGHNPNAGYQLRRRQAKAHQTQYRSLPTPGQPALKVAAVRDGTGNATTISTQPTAASHPLPAGEGRGEGEQPHQPDAPKQPRRSAAAELLQAAPKRKNLPTPEEPAWA